MKGISRMDYKGCRGWFVRVYRNGQTHSKMFSDGPYGGTEAAMEAAVKYKAEYEMEHPEEYVTRRFRHKPQRNNTTGVQGISETFHRDRNDIKLPCFSIAWNPEPNVRRDKRIYHHHYPDRQTAFEAAIAFRKEREAEIEQACKKAEQAKRKGRSVSSGRRRVNPRDTMASNQQSL